MKLRNPMKNKWGQWKDDATLTEKFFWSFIFVSTGMALGSLIASFFNKGLVTNDNIKILKELRRIVFDDDTLIALLKRKQLRMNSKLSVFRDYLTLRESIAEKWN